MPKGTSDDDTGFLWGKAGKKRAKQVEAKSNAGYKMWEREKGIKRAKKAGEDEIKRRFPKGK